MGLSRVNEQESISRVNAIIYRNCHKGSVSAKEPVCTFYF